MASLVASARQGSVAVEGHVAVAGLVAVAWLVAGLLPAVSARGLLLLYRPRDISNDCVFSHQLRYDLSFGNGLSDTISLVFRTLSGIDYECGVEIVTDSSDVFLIVVIRFPNNIGDNCPVNGDAFMVLKKNRCVRICDVIGDRDMNSPYFIISVKGRIRFKFLSNSSLNTDMDANWYQVTATSAREKPLKGCNLRNESICVIDESEYCFTSGVVCDGIKNCGVTDWFDERKSDCELPVEVIGHAPVVAVVALVLCLVLAAGHLLARFLPPRPHSFFIFNANEDNRLCIDPVFQAPDFAPYDTDRIKRISVIPVPSSSSEEEKRQDEIASVEPGSPESQLPADEESETTPENDTIVPKDGEGKQVPRRKNTMRVVTEMFQQSLKAVTSRRKSEVPPDVL